MVPVLIVRLPHLQPTLLNPMQGFLLLYKRKKALHFLAISIMMLLIIWKNLYEMENLHYGAYLII